MSTLNKQRSQDVCKDMPIEPEEWYGVVLFHMTDSEFCGHYEVTEIAQGCDIQRLHWIMDLAMSSGLVRTLMWIERLEGRIM